MSWKSPIQLESGGYLEVGDVLFVPELKRNLVSVSALEDEDRKSVV